jgi:hypothetical protein
MWHSDKLELMVPFKDKIAPSIWSNQTDQDIYLFKVRMKPRFMSLS